MFMPSVLQPRFTLTSSLSAPPKRCPLRKPFIFATSALPSSLIGPAQAAKAQHVFSSIPHLLPPHKDVIMNLVSVVHHHLGHQLQPSSVPPEAQRYQNDDASSHGSLFINRGSATSHIDFVLSSCLYLSLPNNSSIKVTNLHGYMKATTGAPHFLFELCQMSPSQFIFFLDVNPRKDLVLNSDYRKVFYEDSELDSCRKRFYEEVPEATPYVSSSIYFRCVTSPTAILALIKCEEGATWRAEEIVRDRVSSVSEEVIKIWIERCALSERRVCEEDMHLLRKRDGVVKRNAVETDLGATLPKIFGSKGDMVLDVIRAAHDL